MAFLKSIAREIVFPVTVALHLEKLFSSLSIHNRLILCYHGVVDTPQHNISLGPISTKQFAQHLSYFKENFDVVSQDIIIDMYRSNFIPQKKTIAITFDDGYENNYTNAYPLLKKFNFPSTMYIIAQCIEDENKLAWFDYFDFIKNDIDITKIDFGKLKTKVPPNKSQLRSLIKSLNIDKRNILFEELKKQVNLDAYTKKYSRNHWKLMNSKEVRFLFDSGLVEIGSHSYNHPNLGLINIDDAKKEIIRSKEMIESIIQAKVNSIAFPDGSYSSEVKKACLDAGYKNLLAVGPLPPVDKNDVSILPRGGVSSTTTFESNIIQINRSFKYSGF